jgi:hypothetical protein
MTPLKNSGRGNIGAFLATACRVLQRRRPTRYGSCRGAKGKRSPEVITIDSDEEMGRALTGSETNSEKEKTSKVYPSSQIHAAADMS